MTDKNLELSLRIKADLAQGKSEVSAFSAELNKVESSADAADVALNETAAATELLGKKMETISTELQAAGRTFVYAGQSNFSFRDSVKGTTIATEEQSRELARLINRYDAQANAARRLAADEAFLKKAFADGKISADQYNRSLANMHRNSQQLSGSYGTLRGAAQNLGWQLQDIAVQMQAGVNPSVILSQQGSQLVSTFNPLAGAVIAVGGALAGALLPSLFSNKDAAAGLSEQIKELHKDYKTLDESQRGKLIDDELVKQEAAKKRTDELAKSIEELTERYEAMIEARQKGQTTGPAISTMGMTSGPGYVITQERITEAERQLTAARADLSTQNDLLIESENEIRRLKGETVISDAEVNKKATELLDNLKEQAATYRLTGEALGEYMTRKIGVVGALKAEIIEQYKLLDAQEKAAKAEAEAKAADEKKKREAEAKLKAIEDYVHSLEMQAAAISLTTQELRDRQNAERGLTGEMLKRAQAAQKIIDLAKETKALEALEVQLLKAKGSELDAARAEFKQRYDTLLNDLSDTSRERGQQIIEELINLEDLQLQLKKAEQQIDDILSDQQRRETSINTQREAGLITEYEARHRIVELHQETHKLLEQQRPLLEEMARQPGTVGEAAARALEELNAQAEQLLSTVSLLEATLRGSLESGLSDAIQGLAKGTYTFREAVHALATTVTDALIKLGADYLAQSAVKGVFGGGKDEGESMKEGAAATTTAAGLLSSAAALWAGVAAQIQAAAASLAATNAAGGTGGGAGGGGAGGSNYAGLIQLGASLFAAGGGEVVGPGTTTSDSIPAMLSNKEFVTRAAVMMQPGALDFQHDFNRRGMAALADWAPAFHNTGGLAGVPAPAMPSPTLGSAKLPEPSKAFSATVKNSQNFILVDDSSRMSEYLKTPEGEESVFVMLKRNPGKFGSVLKVGGNR